MPKKIIFKQENEETFWQYWQQFISKNRVSPRYLKTVLENRLINSSKSSLLSADKSFVYVIDNEIVGCAFLPLEKNNDVFTISVKGGYVDAPLFNNQKIGKTMFNLIDEIALKNQVAKIMFSVDPLERNKFPYNFLQKYGYLDTSILTYFINLYKKENLLKECRRGHKCDIKSILKDRDYSAFFIDQDNPSYKIHKEYVLLHHKCSGKITRPQETFDMQYQMLKQGNAVLFGLKYKNKNIAYSYFSYNNNKVVYFSSADDPDYDKLPLYHILLYSAMEYFQNKGVDYIDASQPSSPSTQIDYYPDKKQLNIARFKRGFGGNFVENFRGIKYFSKKNFKKDMKVFLENYKKTIES